MTEILNDGRPNDAAPSRLTAVGESAWTDERDRDMVRRLAAGMSALREARPGFQADLEARLLHRLEETDRPWWRRVSTGLAGAGPRRGPRGLRRRSLLGLAAAAAVVLALGTVTMPLEGTPQVSAR